MLIEAQILFLLPNWTSCVPHFHCKLKSEWYFWNSKWPFPTTPHLPSPLHINTPETSAAPKMQIQVSNWPLIKAFHNLLFVSLYSLIFLKLTLTLWYKEMEKWTSLLYVFILVLTKVVILLAYFIIYCLSPIP